MISNIRVHVLGLVIAILTAFTVGGIAFDQYQNHQTVRCQARYNEAFVTALQARSSISDSDRNSLAKLVQEVVNATTREQSRAALQQYLNTKTANDKQREANPLPALPTAPHC